MFFELPLKTFNEGDFKTFLISALWVSIFPFNIQPKYLLITLAPCWVQYANESPLTPASHVLRGRGKHTGWCLKAFTYLSLQTGTQQHDGTHGRCWTRQFQWQVARCPLKQRNGIIWASALPNLPFSWDSSCVLGFNVSQSLCQQMLAHQSSQWAREISKSHSFILRAQ